MRRSRLVKTASRFLSFFVATLSFATIFVACVSTKQKGEQATFACPKPGPHATLDEISKIAACRQQASQSALLDAQLKDDTDKSSLPFVRYITENSAQIPAILTVAVAIFSYYFTQRATRRQQSDSQLSETLKRFTDNNSAALRATSAGMLRLLATRSTPQDFLVVVDQLSTGLRIEPDRQVIEVIEQNLLALSASDASTVFKAITRLYDRMTTADLTEGMALLLGTMYAKDLTHWLTSTPRGCGPPPSIEVALRQMSNTSGCEFNDLVELIWKNRELYLSIAGNHPDHPVGLADIFTAQGSLDAFKFRTRAFVCLIDDLESRADSSELPALKQLVEERKARMRLDLIDNEKSRLLPDKAIEVCDFIIKSWTAGSKTTTRSQCCSALLNKARSLIELKQDDAALNTLSYLVENQIDANERTVRWRVAQALQLLTKTQDRLDKADEARATENMLLSRFAEDDHPRIQGIVSEARNRIAMSASIGSKKTSGEAHQGHL